MGQGRQDHHDRGQQHRRLLLAHVATGEERAKLAIGKIGCPLLVRFGVAKAGEEQQDGKEVEEQFHRK